MPPNAVWQNCSSDRNTVTPSHISHTSWETLHSKAVQIVELFNHHPYHEPHHVELDTGEVVEGYRLPPMHNTVVLVGCQSIAIQSHGQAQHVRVTLDNLVPDLYRKIEDTLDLWHIRATQPVQQQFS